MRQFLFRPTSALLLGVAVACCGSPGRLPAGEPAVGLGTELPSAPDGDSGEPQSGLALAPTDSFPTPQTTGSGAGVGRSEPVPRVPSAPSQTTATIPAFPRYLDWGSGNVSISDPAEYPRIADLDWNDPTSLFDTMRPNLFGSEIEPEFDYQNIIATDRPDFTDATFSVGRGVTIIETGYTFTTVREETSWSREQTMPEFLIRYGLNDDLEIRFRTMGFQRGEQGEDSVDMRDAVVGAADLDLGFKYELWQQDNWVPMLTVVSGSTIPSGTGGTSAYELNPYCNVIAGWGIRRWIYLKVGGTWEHATSNDRVLAEIEPGEIRYVSVRNHGHVVSQSSSLMFQLARNYGYFAEWFALTGLDLDDTRTAHYMDTGFFWNVTPHIQFDIKAGTRLSGRVDEQFYGGGLSFRY